MWMENYGWEENCKNALWNDNDSRELVKLCHLVDKSADTVLNLTASYTKVLTQVI